MSAENQTAAQVLVLGVGNVLLQDEGIGVRVVEELQRRFAIPPAVQILDGGTAGMALIEDMLGKEHIIILDAVKANHPPATVLRLEGEAVPAFFQTPISPHQLGLSDVLAALTLADERPKSMVLIGIVPCAMELSLALSEALQLQLQMLVDMTRAELARLGFALTPKPRPIDLK